MEGVAGRGSTVSASTLPPSLPFLPIPPRSLWTSCSVLPFSTQSPLSSPLSSPPPSLQKDWASRRPPQALWAQPLSPQCKSALWSGRSWLTSQCQEKGPCVSPRPGALPGIKCPLLPPARPAAQETEAPLEPCVWEWRGEDGGQQPSPLGVPGSVPRGDTLKLRTCVTPPLATPHPVS